MSQPDSAPTMIQAMIPPASNGSQRKQLPDQSQKPSVLVTCLAGRPDSSINMMDQSFSSTDTSRVSDFARRRGRWARGGGRPEHANVSLFGIHAHDAPTMGDKSPKAMRKQSDQKQSKSDEDNRRKQA